MNKTIGIAGMGWLGKPFVQRLTTLGFRVKGSVTSIEKATDLNKRGFEVLPVELREDRVAGEPQGFLKHCSILIVMIPPGLRRYTGSDYVLKMSHFLSEIETSDVEKVILVSSTSVYDDSQGTVTEKDEPQPQSDAGKQLLQVEQLFLNAPFIETSVVRFGGLIGGNRQPVKYLAGRKDLRNGEAPVNLIQREDCIGILSEIILKDAFGHIFNGVHPDHPSKKSYYTSAAKKLDLDPPSYANETNESIFKEVNSINLSSVLAYQFSKSL